MQEPTFLVLTVLAGPPLHGYGIMRAIEQMAPDSVRIRPGTLYAALDRLTREGLIVVDREDEWADGRVRRHYRLTDQGSAALRTEADRRQQLATIAISRLASRPHLGPSPA